MNLKLIKAWIIIRNKTSWLNTKPLIEPIDISSADSEFETWAHSNQNGTSEREK